MNTPAPVLEYGTAGSARVPRPPRPPVVRLLLIGLLLLPLTIALGCPVAARLPWGWESGAMVEVPTDRPGQYTPTASFYVSAMGTGRGSGARMTSGYVVYGGRELPGQLSVDFASMTYRLGLYGHEHIGPRPLTRDAMLEYISRAGFDPASAEAAAVADALLGELRKLADGRLPPDLTDQHVAGQVPATRRTMVGIDLVNFGYGHLIWLPWYTPYCLPVWAAAWWLAARPLIRRYRRRLAEYHPLTECGHD